MNAFSTAQVTRSSPVVLWTVNLYSLIFDPNETTTSFRNARNALPSDGASQTGSRPPLNYTAAEDLSASVTERDTENRISRNSATALSVTSQGPNSNWKTDGLREVVRGDRHAGRPDIHRWTVFNQFQGDEFLKCLLDYLSSRHGAYSGCGWRNGAT